jgi:hypothetical protein
MSEGRRRSVAMDGRRARESDKDAFANHHIIVAPRSLRWRARSAAEYGLISAPSDHPGVLDDVARS